MAKAGSVAALAPYVPRMAAEWDLDAPGALWREADATCCFVDISGFTALSERLARRGRIGAEELTEVLNHVFSRMLEVAYGKGGALLKFGGDALLLAFMGDDHATMAAESAVAMRAALREARTLPTSVGRVNLRMSVGIHSGTFHLFRVGDSHRELLVTGPAATATTRMEQTADPGEIVVSHATAACLPQGAIGAAKGDGHLVRWRHVVEEGPGPIPARPVTGTAVESSVPVALRTRLAHGAAESEHRLASVAFVKFQGTDDLITSEGPEAAAEALDAIVSSVQHAADHESVTFLASDIDANGGKIILATGVPAAQEDDEGRLLRAARLVIEQKLPLSVRIGINRGHVFAGDIGTNYRRTFTVMGDTVNLAARLMAAAKPGEIYATGTVLDQARTQFATEALEPFYVKGKSEPVQAYGVGLATGTRSDAFGTLPFRGREKEMTTLLDALGAAAHGRGGTMLVEAERGTGKTRLVTEFVALNGEAQVLWFQGEPHQTGVPYTPLRNAMRTLLEVDARDRHEAGVQLLQSLTRLNADLVPFAALLAPIVDAEVPASPEAEAIAPEFVRQRVADMVIAALDAVCTSSLLIVADDAHWFDDTSSEICARVAAAAGRPWLVLATRRPEAEGGFTPENPDTHLALAPLGDDVARELVESATETAPLRPQEREGVVGRAGGNPLFLEELLLIVRATDVESLPDNLDAVAMREIDALPATPRRVLRLASVLGRAFDRSLLYELLESESVDVGTDPLEELHGKLIAVAAGGQIRFRHALLQEAAYQSLPFRQRLALHRVVGESIERDAVDIEEVAPLLSEHFLAAQEWERTWRYAMVAARVAQKVHAVGEVAVHLERAVHAARRLRLAGAEVASTQRDLGRAFETLGEYERADDAYRNASTNFGSDIFERGQVAERRAYLRSEYLGRTAAAIRLLRSARADLVAAGPEAEGLRALLLAEEADVRSRQGRFRDALDCAGRAAAEAEDAGETKALALSLAIIGGSRVKMGNDEGAAEYLERALPLYEELGDDIATASTLGQMAALTYFAYRWDEAARYEALAGETSTRAGDLAGAALYQGNLGEIRTNQGRLDEAVELLVPARRTLESFGYRAAIAYTAMQLGRARAFYDDVEDGISMLRTAIVSLDEIGSHFEALEARTCLVEVLVFAARFPEARAELSVIRDRQRALGETLLTPMIERVELTLEASSGDGGVPTSELDGFLERAQDLSATYEQLVVMALMERLGDHRHHEELVRIAHDLGVVRLPMFKASRVSPRTW
jgi:class 3 adenylate cyclase/tetratricopeptide (TPR) repeat protein